jgi:hypothetical protein
MEARKFVVAGVLGAWSLACAGACIGGRECTEIGCMEGAAISVKTSDGTWPAGKYEMSMSSEGVTHACSITLPDDFPTAPGALAQWSCDTNLSPLMFPESVCTEVRSGTGVSQSCTPIPGKFVLEISPPGSPASFEIKVLRDQQELLNEQRTLTYVDTEPNGPGCGVCRRASAELALADGAP